MSGPRAPAAAVADPLLATPGRRRLPVPIWTDAEISLLMSFGIFRGPLPSRLTGPAAVGVFYAGLGPVACRAAVGLIEDAVYGCLVLEGAAPEAAEVLAAEFGAEAWRSAQAAWMDGTSSSGFGADGEAQTRH